MVVYDFPLSMAIKLNDKALKRIIANSISVLDKAIEEGGTTIRS